MLLLVAAAMAQGPSPKIINGADASEGDFPATGGMLMGATLSFQGNGQDIRQFVCSSTLIAPDTVLLAAHCIDEFAFTFGVFELNNTDIRWTRQADLSALDGSSQSLAAWPSDAVVAADWVYHPSWDMQALGTGLTENRDIALIFLDEPVLDVDFMYLATAEEAQDLDVGIPVMVVGWGQQIATGFGQASPEGSYGYKQMGESFIAELSAFEFKVGELESDVRKCHGDSGGPSFAQVGPGGDWRLVGVTSHAYDQSDCNETGGVDTRVDYYLDWIDAEMRARCEDGSRSWCEEPGVPDASLVPDLVEEPSVVELEEKKRLFGCSSTPSQRSLGFLGLAAGLLMLGRRRRS